MTHRDVPVERRKKVRRMRLEAADRFLDNLVASAAYKLSGFLRLTRLTRKIDEEIMDEGTRE